MKRLALVLALLLPLSAFSSTIRIGSFNIADFGEGTRPASRDLPLIAQLLVDADLDLVAIQEVGTITQAAQQVDNLVAQMNQRLASGTPRYTSLLTDQSGDERTAVIFRAPVQLNGEVTWLDEDVHFNAPEDGGITFFRVPPAIPFRAGNFDFVVVGLHLTWGNLQRREAEIAALKAYLDTHDPSEDDYIILGDTNRYGKYKASDAKAFDQLLVGNWSARYRFPLLEAITDPDDMTVRFAPTDATSTTVAASRNLYDQFIITAGAFREFGTTSPVLDTHVGVLAFDRAPAFSNLTFHQTKARVSDHRPIWIRFRTNLADDD